ncbi:MAG: CbiQ family ECF transporter T component [Isosphaeraceae bacterium]|nr:CbiQ family ECF transporter T component [Isosphaeraceae bacterium]
MSSDAAARISIRTRYRLDDRVILLMMPAFVCLVVLLPVGQARPLAAAGVVLAFAVGLSGIDPAVLLRRWLGLTAVFGFLAVMVALGRPERATLGLGPVVASILAKNALALTAVLTTVHVLGLPRIVRAARALGLPDVPASSLLVMERYRHVLGEESARMLRARRARSFRRGRNLDWVILSGMIGLLFVRSFERGERVHAAMLARGWNGSMPELEEDSRR